MLELARRVPTVLTALARLPQLMVHGDASPQNLLVPANDPDSFVAIDWTLGGLAAVGDDLGQLLVGLAHADQLPTAELPGLREVLVPAYTAGLAVEGMLVDQAAVGYGLDGDWSYAARSPRCRWNAWPSRSPRNWPSCSAPARG